MSSGDRTARGAIETSEDPCSEKMVAALPAAKRIGGRSGWERQDLVNASEGWAEHHRWVRTWGDESDDVNYVLNDTTGASSRNRALWDWLEDQRLYWARYVALVADVLAAADHPDADSFTATAMALIEGQDLTSIPAMADIHAQTIEAWIRDN